MTGNGRGGSSPLLSTKKHHDIMVFFSIYKNKPNSVPWCEPKDGHVSWYIIADILFASELFQFQQVLKRAALAPGRVYHAILLPVCE